MNDQKFTVLLVEDEPLISEIVAKSLKLEGYHVEIARSGEEGLALVKESPPDLILLDVLLPKIDGWEVLTQLRDDPRTDSIPIIMLTALTDENSKIQGLRGGADDYVTKPFSALELMARVDAVMKRVDRPVSRDSFRAQIPARKGDKIFLVNVDDINYVNIQRDYTFLHTDTDRYMTSHTLADLERILDPDKFFRAHRGFIVNLQKVKEIVKVGTSSYELTMKDPAGSKVPMSRRQSSELKRILNM